MTVQEVLELGSGSVIQLDRMVGEPIDIYVSDRKLAEGEVVVIGEHFGVRITRIVAGTDQPVAQREHGLMLGALASLLFTIGMLALGVWALRRFAPGAARPGGGRLPLEVLRRVATGPKHGVALLRVGERVLLVSLADDGARLLTELEGTDLRSRAANLRSTSAVPPGCTPRPGLLRYLPLVLALVAAADLPRRRRRPPDASRRRDRRAA